MRADESIFNFSEIKAATRIDDIRSAKVDDEQTPVAIVSGGWVYHQDTDCVTRPSGHTPDLSRRQLQLGYPLPPVEIHVVRTVVVLTDTKRA